ncbi:uroporphyrin-III C/tetrapyrrole (Corrin/Porphyrin) methyltransferase [Halogeometricum pallidum JCM 14848]|uniref:Uroporphyrin-III C/tetrapyrrole (Corrin/Porphyrin) methyltransferase n=1 Tax=Halogeometricum pallidum JCM 14848 TaxID=1227487 RepID=M0DEN1_HALPD|nr:SAM-dependent methyltransferase [Halogeometricum pallidum]ELZ33920.1 uroporphyrin-III C/tetrapyrrole (Corrin/Porphyrin) methyltransferase [Halogeometricum pallidum JCM 14848]
MSETDPAADGAMGTLYVVGIGPGLPHAMTQRAKDVVATADCVIASNLYQEFLRRDGTLPPEDAEVEAAPDGGTTAEAGPGTVFERRGGVRQTLVRSTMGQQIELAREAFQRVRAGEDVAHVSGGDPNVYGKSDLLFTMAEEDEAYDVPIEVVPGVTAALGGAANLGAPLSNDFCTVSLSDKWRGWDEIEEKLRAAAISGFVIVLYNCWRDYQRAVDVIREERADDVPVGIFNDAGRGDAGRNLEDETHTITTLGEANDHEDEVGGMGTSLLVGTHETTVWENDHGKHLVTPRGGRDVDDF